MICWNLDANLSNEHSAYYLQCCGFRSQGVRGKAYDLGHGYEFHAVMRTIHEHFLPGEENVWRRPRHLDRDSVVPPCYYNLQAGRSDCCSVRRTFDKFQAEQWPKLALTLTLSRQAYRKANE